MELVAIAAALFALGCYLGRNLSYGWGWVFFIGAFACLIGMRAAVRGSSSSAARCSSRSGFLLGLGTAPTIAYYAGSNPHVVWEAGGATALFMAGFGAAGYPSRRDLSGLARLSFWALVALIAFGIVTMFVQIPNGSLIYSIAGLVLFAGLTMVDFQGCECRAMCGFCAVACRVDLPRRPQRLSLLLEYLR
jgi:uncharacterized protein